MSQLSEQHGAAETSGAAFSGGAERSAPESQSGVSAQSAPAAFSESAAALSAAGLRAERGQFYKSLFAVVAPIALQNLLSAAVGTADVVMLGHIGQTAIAAASLANYVQFILFLFFVGLSSGVIMLAAQYWGKKDTRSIETIFGTGAKLSAAIGLAAAVLATCFPRLLMRAFTGDAALIEEGARYLRIVGVSYFLLSFSQIYQATLKSIERVAVVTGITTVTLLLNIFGNAVFIFGLFGAPELGIRGVALATTLSRVVEVALCVLAASRVRELRLSPSCLFRKNAALFRDFIRYSLPAIGNEVVWGAAFAMYAVIMGHLGADLVAANSLVNVLRNLATILCFGMAYGGAILIGKEIGSGDLARAGRNASRLIKITVLAGAAGAALLACARPLLFRMAELTAEATAMLSPLLFINCLSVLGAAVNTVLICGIFRSGGDAKFGFVLDTVIMWVVSVPLGFLAAFALRLNPVLVYLILYLDEWEKMAFNIAHYKSRRWLKNITREF